MELYLMQHGLCLSEAEDPRKPLSPEGRKGIETSARALAKMGLSFDLILTSDKLRAKETAEIIAKGVGYQGKIQEHQALKPLAPPEEALGVLKDYQAEKVLIVGHLPSLARIASYLLGGEKGVRIRFKNGGLVALETDLSPGEAELICVLTPEQLALIAG